MQSDEALEKILNYCSFKHNWFQSQSLCNIFSWFYIVIVDCEFTLKIYVLL
jgi:hypothetical protein